MSLLDGIKIAEHAMNVHRYRSEVAAENLANVFTPGYRQKRVVLEEGRFNAALRSATAGSSYGGATGGPVGAAGGAVRVARVDEVNSSPENYRAQALIGATEMMQSKNAFELSMRATTMMKSMALGALEIGRGG
jgi:flagellar basal body rod protein FlgC